MHALGEFLLPIAALVLYCIFNLIISIMYWWTFKRKDRDRVNRDYNKLKK